jgi:hypothetical protein
LLLVVLEVQKTMVAVEELEVLFILPVILLVLGHIPLL